MKNYFEALEAAKAHNSALDPWEHDQDVFPVWVSSESQWENVRYAGAYGTFENPIVELGGG